jgi:hypothetical protein
MYWNIRNLHNNPFDYTSINFNLNAANLKHNKIQTQHKSEEADSLTKCLTLLKSPPTISKCPTHYVYS